LALLLLSAAIQIELAKLFRLLSRTLTISRRTLQFL
jgi:hypothetical protein